MNAFLFIFRWVLIGFGFGVAFIAILSTRYVDDNSRMGRAFDLRRRGGEGRARGGQQLHHDAARS